MATEKEKEGIEPLCVRKRKCLTEMREIIRLIGPWSVSKAQMAKKYHIEWHTAQNWFTNLLKEIPREQIDNIKIMGEASSKQALAVCERILADPNSKVKDKLDASSRITDILKNYTEFLEQYNMKPKVADQISVSGGFDINKLIMIAQESNMPKTAESRANLPLQALEAKKKEE